GCRETRLAGRKNRQVAQRATQTLLEFQLRLKFDHQKSQFPPAARLRRASIVRLNQIRLEIQRRVDREVCPWSGLKPEADYHIAVGSTPTEICFKSQRTHR